MALPTPNLDDRRFQDLVDDAKRLVQRRCPEWTDHNVSDPGVTLIEAFAFMVDQLLYRLNRVPERNYVKFLELIGIRLFPPTAARTGVTFWLSAPQEETMEIPADTAVSTRRTEALAPVTFSTTETLHIKPCRMTRIASQVIQGEVRDHTATLENGQAFFCFDREPKVDDMLYIGLNEPCQQNAVNLRFNCEIEGVGVDPKDPPVRWEAWDGNQWSRCEVDMDTTGGFNKAGDVVLHLPRHHDVFVLDGIRAGWVRCRLVAPIEHQPFYSASPKIISVEAFTVGGTVDVIHAEVHRNEILGTTEGVAHQEFSVKHPPVVRGPEEMFLELSDEDEGWQEWKRVDGFAKYGPEDRVFTLDETTGTIQFGPAVVNEHGDLVSYGAVPKKGAIVRLSAYRSGGGREGGVAKGAISVLKSSIPFISRVNNRYPAAGGVDGETVEQAKVRGPILLKTRDRAVTTEDYEVLAKEAAPEVARVSCAAADYDGASANGVRVLIVPTAGEDDIGRIQFADLVPPEDLSRRISDYLDERRILGTRISVEPPRYLGLTVVTAVRCYPKSDPMRVEADCLEALYRYFHPITGGPLGKGWPFGRPIAQGEVFSVLQKIRGVEMIESVRLFSANAVTGERSSQPVDRIVLDPHVLPFSFDHQVRVLQ